MKAVTLRPFRGRDDYPAIAALRNRQVEFGDGGKYTTVDQVGEYYDHMERTDPASDIIVAENAAGNAVGYGRVEWNDVTEGHREYQLRFDADGTDGPDADVEALLLDWLESRATAIAGAHPAGDKRLTTFADLGAARTAHLRQRGFTPTSYSVLMVCSLAEPIPELDLPPPIECRPVADSDIRTIWHADVESFRDSRGYVEQTETDFQRFRAEAARSTALWQVAWNGDVVVGQVRSYVNPGEAELIGRRRAWTEDISTRREWRGRGVASALIAASLRQLAEFGFEEAALGADVDGPTRALELYQRLGYREIQRGASFEKPM
jgi:mycothiol synthase